MIRNFEESSVSIRLEKSLDFEKVLRSSGRKMCGVPIRVEGIPVEKWEAESKNSSKRPDRERERERERPDRSERDRERERERLPRPEPAETNRDRDREVNDFRGRERDRCK